MNESTYCIVKKTATVKGCDNLSFYTEQITTLATCFGIDQIFYSQTVQCIQDIYDR